jgi:hypothetical protein
MLGDFQIRHTEGEVIHRVDAECAGAPRGFDEPVDLCHVPIPPELVAREPAPLSLTHK